MTDTLTPEEFLALAVENERLEAIAARQAEEILKLVARAERAESTARDAVAQSGRHIQNRIGLESTIARQDAQMKRQQEQIYTLRGDHHRVSMMRTWGNNPLEIADLTRESILSFTPDTLRAFATVMEEQSK